MSAQIIKLGEGYFFLKIQNLMKPSELSEIWEEINFLSYRRKLLSTSTGTATTNDGQLRSNKVGVWLDKIYSEKNYSNYLKYYKKWITDEALQNLISTSFFWRVLTYYKNDCTLLSYYEDKKYYSSHIDLCYVTQLFWTFKHPKKFHGGQLIFEDFNYRIEIEDNMMVLFPSYFLHRVEPVILEEKTPDNQDKFLCNGRYVFTTFYN